MFSLCSNCATIISFPVVTYYIKPRGGCGVVGSVVHEAWVRFLSGAEKISGLHTATLPSQGDGRLMRGISA